MRACSTYKLTVLTTPSARATAALACLAPPDGGSFNSAHVYGTHVPVKEPSTASKADERHRSKKALFDHLVGSGEYLLRNREAKLPRGLYIDNEMELHGLFDRKIGGLAPFQNLIKV